MVFEPAIAGQLAVARWTAPSLEQVRSVVTFVGSLVTAAAVFFGAYQYYRAEKWRRREFVAKEIKEFQSNPVVHNVLLMIDWAKRRINIGEQVAGQEEQWPEITRQILWRALLPHTVKAMRVEWLDTTGSRRFEDGEGRRGQFSRTEVRIRDAFDTFLEALERFAAFIESSLVTAKEFRPYLSYWITDLAQDQGDADDARFRCVFFAYIHFYRFDGVLKIFREFGYDVTPTGALFRKLRARM